MSRGIVKGSTVEADPVEVWLHGQPVGQEVPVPAVAKPEHTYGDQGVELEPEVPAEPAVGDSATCLAGHANPAGAKFCMECGAGFERLDEDWHCAQQHQVPASARFCPACGAARFTPPVSGAGVAVELAARPVPEELLTPAQRAERARQHAAALRAGSELPPLRYERPSAKEQQVIHIKEDGLTAFGQVWYRGQEIKLDVGSERWAQAQAWINMDEAAQYERYGRVLFGPGPWPGRRSYTEGLGGFEPLSPIGSGGQVSGPTLDQLKEADRREQARAGGVPAPSLR